LLIFVMLVLYIVGSKVAAGVVLVEDVDVLEDGGAGVVLVWFVVFGGEGVVLV
jgi:hypothetical protein